jgi:hypothetical protein
MSGIGALVYNYLKRNVEESGPLQSTAKLQNRTAVIQHSSALLMLLLCHSGRTRRTMRQLLSFESRHSADWDRMCGPLVPLASHAFTPRH